MPNSNLPAVVRIDGGDLTILDPDTGEVVDLADAPVAVLAKWRAAIVEHGYDVKDAARILDAEVLRRMDAAAEWTLHVGDLKLSAPSPKAGRGVEWRDVEALRDELLFLDLAPDVVDAAFEPVTEFRPRAAGIGKLRKLDRPEVDEALARHAVEVDKPRRVSVKADA